MIDSLRNLHSWSQSSIVCPSNLNSNRISRNDGNGSSMVLQWVFNDAAVRPYMIRCSRPIRWIQREVAMFLNTLSTGFSSTNSKDRKRINVQDTNQNDSPRHKIVTFFSELVMWTEELLNVPFRVNFMSFAVHFLPVLSLEDGEWRAWVSYFCNDRFEFLRLMNAVRNWQF